MNVCSLELAKELYSVSDWTTGYWYCANCEKVFDETIISNHELKKLCPAYDLGFMIRKLPGTILKHAVVDDKDFYFAEYLIGNNPNFTHGTGGDTPEDCLAMLAIELFKQGVLEKES